MERWITVYIFSDSTTTRLWTAMIVWCFHQLAKYNLMDENTVDFWPQNYFDIDNEIYA